MSAEYTDILGQLGDMEARIASCRDEVRQAQHLRYRVFKAANEYVSCPIAALDEDRFDAVCDHLLIFDAKTEGAGAKVVGTYRLLRQEVAQAGTGFYSQDEYDVAGLLDRHKNLKFMELGRSCVEADYRNKRTIELLWHSTWSYALHHSVDVMFGCASFAGTDPSRWAEEISYLCHHAPADGDWGITAAAGRGIAADMLPISQINPRMVLRKLPPLIKGYLKIGAMFSRQAVIDHHFGTTDLLIVLPISRISPRYLRYYGVDASRHAPQAA